MAKILSVSDKGIATVIFEWSTEHGPCYECGLPAAFWIPNAAVDSESPLAPHASEKRCAVCAANAAADGEYVRRIREEEF